jgi:hypothetical protein
MKRGLTIFFQILTVVLGIGVLALLLWEPQIEGVNAYASNFDIYLKDPFLAIVYTGSIAFFVALYQIFKALRYVRKNNIFSEAGVKTFRAIKYCALVIIGFVVIEETFIMSNTSDDRAGGVFMGVLITFGSIIVAFIAKRFELVLKNVVDKNN